MLTRSIVPLLVVSVFTFASVACVEDEPVGGDGDGDEGDGDGDGGAASGSGGRRSSGGGKNDGGETGSGGMAGQTRDCLDISGPGTKVPSTVSGKETWSLDGAPYIIDQHTVIEGDVTIEPCVAVLLAEDVIVTVRGTLSAQGAAVEDEENDGEYILYPVAFVPLVEDERWGGLDVDPSGFLELKVTGIHGASSADGAIHARGDDQYGLPHRNVRVQAVSIEDSAGPGIVLEIRAGFTEDSDGLVINSAGDDDIPYPISIEAGAVATLPATITLENNEHNEIQVVPFRPVFEDTFKALGYPYAILGPIEVAQGNDGGLSGLAQVVIEPGVTLRMFDHVGSGFFVGNGVDHAGILIAEGTEEEPIRFESGLDDAAPGDWLGIYFYPPMSAGNSLKFVEVAHAGGPSGANGWGCGPSGNAASILVLNDQPVTPFIENCVIEEAGGDTQILLGWDYDESPEDSAAAYFDANEFDDAGPECRVSLPQDATSQCPGLDFEPDCL